MESKSLELKMPKKAEEMFNRTIKIATLNASGKSTSKIHKPVSCKCTEKQRVKRKEYKDLAEKIEKDQIEYEDLREADKFAFKFITDEKLEKKSESKEAKKKAITKYTPSQKLSNLRESLDLKRNKLASMKKDILAIECECWADEEYLLWDEKDLIYVEGEEYPYHTIKGVKHYLGPDGYFVLESSCDSEYCDEALTENSVLWDESEALYDPNLQAYYHTYKSRRYIREEDDNYYSEKVIQTKKYSLALGSGSYYRGPLYKKLHRCDWHGGLLPKDQIALSRSIFSEKSMKPVYDYANPLKTRPVVRLVDKDGKLVKKTKYVTEPVLGDPPNCGVYVYIKYGNKLDVVCYDNCRNTDMNNLMLEANNNDEKVAKLRKFAKQVDAVWKDTEASFNVSSTFIKNAKLNRAKLEDLIRKTSGIADNDSRKKQVEKAELLKNKTQKEYKDAELRAEQNWLRKVAKVKDDILNKSRGDLSQINLTNFSYEELNKIPYPNDNALTVEKRFYNAVMDYLDYYDDVKEGVVDPALLNSYMLKILEIDKQITTNKIAISNIDFDKLLNKEFDQNSDNELEVELFNLIKEYNDEKSESNKSLLEKKIISLNDELEEELASDRDFQEGLKNILVVKNENDISEAAHQRYIITLCQTEKTYFTKANSDYELKLRNFEKDSKDLAKNIEEKQNCSQQEKQNESSMYETISRAHFSGRWFLEQSSEFDVIRTIKGFTLNEETPADDETHKQEKFRLEEEKKMLDKAIKNVTEKSNNIRNNMKKTSNMLSSYDQRKIELDYEEFKSNQLLAMRTSRQERAHGPKYEEGVIKNYSSVVTMQIQNVVTTQQIGEEKKAIRIPISFSKGPTIIQKFETPLVVEDPTNMTKMQQAYRIALMKRRAAAIKSPTEIKKILTSPKTPVEKSSPVTKTTIRAPSPTREASPTRKPAPIRVAPILSLKPMKKTIEPPIKTSSTTLNVEKEKIITPLVASPSKPRTGVTIKIVRPRVKEV